MLQNPRLLEDMKQQLQQKLNDELIRWDVQPVCTVNYGIVVVSVGQPGMCGFN